MRSTTRVLAAGHDSAFLHLIQTLLDDIGIPVSTTSNWHKVPGLAAKLVADLAILDLAPGSEMSCWLTAEALRSQPATSNIRILLCPVAWWLIDEHREQMDRLAASVWSGKFELEELFRLVADALHNTRSLQGNRSVKPTMPSSGRSAKR
jgi:DNA-binding NtrC family response regulator